MRENKKKTAGSGKKQQNPAVEESPAVKETAAAQTDTDIKESAAAQADADMQELAAAADSAAEEQTGDVLDVNIGSARFIKTGTTPFLSVRAERAAEEPVTGISNFADRLTTKSAAEKIHTGYTGKLNTYDAVHSAAQSDGRMIRPQPDAEKAEAGAETDDVKTFSFDEDAAQTAADTAPDAEIPAITVHTDDDAPSDGKTKMIAPVTAELLNSQLRENTKSDLLREIADSAETDVRRNPDQLMMEGFNDPEKEKKERERRKKEAEVLEKELSRSRAKLVNGFRFRGRSDQQPAADEKFSSEPRKEDALPDFLKKISDRFKHLPDDFTPVNAREYSDYNERKAVFNALMEARRGTLARIGVVGLLGLVLLLINMIAHISAVKNGGFFTVLGGNYNVFSAVNLVFLLLTAVLMFPELKNGVVSALKIRPRADSVLLLLLAGAAVQNIASFFTKLRLETDFRMFTPAAILLCIPYLCAKLFYYDNARHCFKSVAAKSDKTYLRKVTDADLIRRLLRDDNADKSNVVYAGKTRFIGSFLRRSARAAYDVSPGRRTVFFTVSLSVIAGLLAWILKGSFLYCTAAFELCLAAAFPVCGLIASGWMIAAENKKLSLKSSFILRYQDAHDFSAVDNIAVDADELVSGTLSDCLTADGVRERQARFVAAAVAAKAGGIAASTFAADIEAFRDKLPEAETVVYEDKLGLSAWVNGCKVLLGNRQLLEHHNVEAPGEEPIASILSTGELPLFLAMEGHFTAVFAVRYAPREQIAAGLSALVKRGANLLVTTTDPNVSETFTEHLLGLSTDCVRLIGSAAAQQFAGAKSARSDTEDAGVVFADSFQSLCRCAAAAIRLERTQKLAQTLCAIGSWVMLAIGMLLTATGVFAKMSVAIPLLLQILWIAACMAAPILTGRLDKKENKDHSAPRERTAAIPISAQDAGMGSDAGTPTPADAPAGDEPEMELRLDPDAETESGEAAPAPEKTDAPAADEGDFDAPDLAQFDADPAPTPRKPAQPARPAGRQNVLKKIPDAKNVLGSVKGLFSRLTAPADVDDETDDAAPRGERSAIRKTAAAPDAAPAKTPASDDSFSLFTAGEERYRVDKTAGEIESDYESDKSIAAEVRKTFTMPEEPEAPFYDLSKKEEPDPVLNAEFIPPREKVDLYDDALFSRFEDDKIFAGLYDENGNRTRD